MKKTIILTVFALMLMSTPLTTRAGFDPTCIIDPFSLFACDKDPKVVNTTVNNTNSNNVNSNINSTVTNNNSNPVIAQVPSTPIYVYDNYYNYNTNPNYSQLGVSCYSTVTATSVGNTVYWRASAYGGTGNYYISWSGSEGLSGTGSSIAKSYAYAGSKSASVVVTSGGQSVSQNCNSVEVNGNNYNYNYDYNYNYNYNNNYGYNYNYYSPLTVSCTANVTFAPVGTRVVWQANVSGGNGGYYYTWYGTDNLTGYNTTNEVYYNNPGVKNAYVTVRSNNQTITQYCSNTVTVGVPNNVYTAPVYTAPTKTIVKYVEVPAKKEIVKETPVVEKGATLASLFSLENVPWGWVAILVIIVLLVTVIYLLYNEKKI